MNDIRADPVVSPLEHTVTQLLGGLVTQGNQVEILRDGSAIYPAMLEAIESATTSIEFCTYLYGRGAIADRFADALIDAADRGVSVRVIVDSFGALRMPASVRKRLRASRCRIRWFRPFHWWLPFNNHRTHRKLLICDQRLGFIGGAGVGEQWTDGGRRSRPWRETHFRVRGELVPVLRAAFLDNWLEVCPGDLPDIHAVDPESGTGGRGARAGLVVATANNRWSRMATLLHGVVARVERRLDLCSPYFVPDRRLAGQLSSAARRGVDIRVLTASPRHSDSIASYLAGAGYLLPLMEAGVRIFRYRPTFIHSKLVLADDFLTIAGSSNLNQRSLKKDDEASFVCLDRDVCQTLTEQFEDDLDQSAELTPRRFRGRGWLTRAGEWLIRPFQDSV